MLKKIFNIYKNANKSIFLNPKNDTVDYKSLIFIYIIFFALSILLVYIKKDKFIEDSKILAMLLSLFSGLMYSVLLKIPDKLNGLKTIEISIEDSLQLKKEKTELNIINSQIFNYLKIFSYTLSYAILVAIFCIIIVIICSFFPQVLDFKLSTVELNFVNINILFSVKILIIIFIRFLFVFFMLHFLYFIIKSVIFLSEFTTFEFKNLDKKIT